MILGRLNATGPERLFTSVKNSYSTATVLPGWWVAYDVVTDQDGVAVTKPSGANRGSIAGVMRDSVAHLANGLCQVWGYTDSARCLGGSGSLTSKITAGQPLKFATSGFAAQAFARNSAQLKSAHGKFACGIGMAPTNTAAIDTQAGTSGAYKVFVKCM